MRVDEISNAKLLKIRSYTENFNIFRGEGGSETNEITLEKNGADGGRVNFKHLTK